MIEVEIRAPVPHGERQAIEDRLAAMGCRLVSEVVQRDVVLDRPDGSLFHAGQKLRLRVSGDVAELTYKGTLLGDPEVSRRTEATAMVPAGAEDALIAVLAALGFPPLFTITKRRRRFRGIGLDVALDEWPIVGLIMEVEGSEEAARALASRAAPGVKFRNYRLAELLRMAEVSSGRSLSELQADHESRTGERLGRLSVVLESGREGPR